MSAPDIRKDVETAVKALARLQGRTLPIKAGNRALALTRKRFTDGGFDGKKWQEPYRRRLSFDGTEGRNRTLLSGNNHLRDSTYAKAYPGKVYIRNQVEYGAMHNYGGSITVTAKMKRYFWYRYIQIVGSKGNAVHSPVPSQLQFTRKGRLSRNRRNQSLSREAEFWRNMALKRAGSMIRIPRRRFMGPDRNMEKEIRTVIDKELTNFIKKYGTYFTGSR